MTQHQIMTKQRIISSLSQDLFYAVHQGKKLTPKNILLPLLIKSLTNNTKLITTISRLGHSVSYTKLREVITEVAYSRIDNNVDGMICLPEKCKKGCFTMLVEDNIDRNEKTLTGTHFYCKKLPAWIQKTIELYYCIRLLYKFLFKMTKL